MHIPPRRSNQTSPSVSTGTLTWPYILHYNFLPMQLKTRLGDQTPPCSHCRHRMPWQLHQHDRWSEPQSLRATGVVEAEVGLCTRNMGRRQLIRVRIDENDWKCGFSRLNISCNCMSYMLGTKLENEPANLEVQSAKHKDSAASNMRNTHSLSYLYI